MATVHDPMKDRISLHGLGFLQIKLGGDQRLHVWHPELPRRSCWVHSSIHDHRFSFRSTVIVGTQINHDYYASAPDIGRPATHMAYLHEGARTPNGGRPWVEDQLLVLRPAGTKIVQAGEAYRVPKYKFHSTEPGGDGRVATIMAKTSEGEAGARSLCRVGIQPEVDFNRYQMTEGEMWAIAIDVLGARAEIIDLLKYSGK